MHLTQGLKTFYRRGAKGLYIEVKAGIGILDLPILSAALFIIKFKQYVTIQQKHKHAWVLCQQ